MLKFISKSISTILRKIIVLAFWFICFGLSLLVSNVFRISEQGVAFLIIHIILCALCIYVCVYPHVNHKVKNELITIFLLFIGFIYLLLGTLAATKLFNIDYFVTYQIITFGMSLLVK